MAKKPGNQRRTAPTARRKNAGTSGYNAPLNDEIKAAIWVYAEEGRSQRWTAEKLEISPSAVGRELVTDPVRLESLRARLREERGTGFKNIETKGIAELEAWLERLGKWRTGEKRMGKRNAEEFKRLPQILSAVAGIIGMATRSHQLLTGGATERLDHGGDKDGDATPEQLIQMAIECGGVDLLPPPLREKARKLAKEQA